MLAECIQEKQGVQKEKPRPENKYFTASLVLASIEDHAFVDLDDVADPHSSPGAPTGPGTMLSVVVEQSVYATLAVSFSPQPPVQYLLLAQERRVLVASCSQQRLQPLPPLSVADRDPTPLAYASSARALLPGAVLPLCRSGRRQKLLSFGTHSHA